MKTSLRLAGLVATVASSASLAHAQLPPPPATFPADGAFAAIECSDPTVVPSQDSCTDEARDHRNVIGGGAQPAYSYAQDGTYLYLRLRVEDDPRQSEAFVAFAWGFGIDSDGDGGFEAYISLIGQGNEDRVEILDQDPDNGTTPSYTLLPGGGGDTSLRPIDSSGATPSWAIATSAGSNFCVDDTDEGDWHITVAVPLVILREFGALGGVFAYGGTSSEFSGIQNDYVCSDGNPASCMTDTDCPSGICLDGEGRCAPPILPVFLGCLDDDAEPDGIDDGCDAASPFCIVTATTSFCAECEDAADCSDDGNECTSATCSEGVCGATPVPVGTVCAAGSCNATGNCVGCTSDANCGGSTPRCELGTSTCVECLATADCVDDGNECTAETCTSGACGRTDLAFGTACSGGICDANVDCSALTVDLATPADDSLTRNPRPAITGTATPGATVGLEVDGVMVGTATANESGAWSFALGADLVDGPHMIVAVVVVGATMVFDGADVTVDTTTAVAVTEPMTGSSSTDTTPTITGTGEPGAMVTVVLDGMTLDVITIGMDGTWSVAVVTALAEGMHTVIATATDAAGNTAMDTSIFTVDTSTTVAITSPADGTRVMTTTPTISGTTEPGASVVVSVDGTEIGTVTADGAGNWSIMVTTALTEGPHSASASATDTLGNMASAESDFTVDLGTRVTWEQPSVTGDATPELSGTGEPGATVEVSIDGSVVGSSLVDAEGNWTLVVGPLTDGVHDVSVVATDDAGNTATDDGSFLVDLDAPAVEIANPADGSTTSDTTPTINGTATLGASVLVIVDGRILGRAVAGTDGRWSIEVTTALAAGEHEVVATVTDAEGDTVEDAHTFTVDADAPSVTLSAPSGTTNDPTPTIAGTADANVTVQVFVDGVFVGTTTADGDGDWSLDVTTVLGDGPHTVRAVAVDAEGDTATAADAFVVDTGTDVVIDAPVDGATVPGPRPTIVGTAEPGATVVVSIGGAEIGTVIAGADGRWSLRAPTDLAPGDHTATADATDLAGNTASASSTFTISDVLDTDGDGFPDTEECPTEPCRDSDEDGTPDFEDPDDDGDGIPTAIECPGATSCQDNDADTSPDYLDPDDDGDGILTLEEGSGSLDTNRDGTPDHLDVDDDGDGLLTLDECTTDPCVDTDMDGRPNYVDADDDGDAIPTTRERADGATHGDDVDGDDDVNWLDTDADGADGGDTEEGIGDADMDGIPDYLDPSVVPMPDGGVDGGVDGGIEDDAGSPPVDAGVDGGVEDDAGTPPTGGGYAGGALCAASSGSDSSAAFGLALVGLALAWRRRRR